mmetsp:Transcript_24112/g.55681  ORF Transcript_24112/g.55681 Transcript_24112/m.55681 type:complete len:371 (+) Transcript_24112:99-1211(+)
MPATKRGSQAPAPAPKKAKVNPKLRAMEETISAQTSLSSEVKAMLLAMLPHSLGVPAVARAEHQQRVANMIASVVQEEKSRLEAAAKEEEGKVGELENSKEQLEETSRSFEELVKDAVETADRKQAALAEATASFAKAKEGFDTVMGEQKTHADAAAQAKEMKVALEVACSTHFKALSDGDWSTAGAKTHLDALMPLLKTLNFEDTLVSALPGACMRDPASRGGFDTAVLDQLKAQIETKVEELGKTAEAKESEASAMQAAVDEKREAFEECTQAKEAAAQQKDAAAKSKQELEVKLRDAKKAVVSYEPNVTAARKALKAKQDELEYFIAFNVGSLEALLHPPPAKAAVTTGDAPAEDAEATSAPEVGGA